MDQQKDTTQTPKFPRTDVYVTRQPDPACLVGMLASSPLMSVVWRAARHAVVAGGFVEGLLREDLGLGRRDPKSDLDIFTEDPESMVAVVSALWAQKRVIKDIVLRAATDPTEPLYQKCVDLVVFHPLDGNELPVQIVDISADGKRLFPERTSMETKCFTTFDIANACVALSQNGVSQLLEWEDWARKQLLVATGQPPICNPMKIPARFAKYRNRWYKNFDPTEAWVLTKYYERVR